LRKHLERRDVRVELALPADAPRVLGDVVQLQQVTLNLLLNACEAMGPNGDRRELRIEMAEREVGILHIAIRDSGKGVAEADLESIFERFVTTKPDGLGMGLSISRSIVGTHGGRIWATRNPERGLTMHVELPCQEPSVRPGVEAKVQ